MTAILYAALYIGWLVATFILMEAEVPAGFILFAFFFVAIFGGLFVWAADRPQLIPAGFLLVSLIVVGDGYYGVLGPAQDWRTVDIGAFLAFLSAVTFLWTLVTYKPPPPTAEVTPARAARRPVAARPKATPMEALKCPNCGNPKLEGGYPEYWCSYCGSRFAGGEVPTGVAAGVAADCVNVVLVQAGENRIEVVKAVRQVTRLDLHAAADLVNTPDSVVVEAVPPDEGERIKAALEQAGATVTLERGEGD